MLASMMLASPTFIDRLGDFPDRNIDTEFAALKESFSVVPRKLGEERYAQLIDMADRMRAISKRTRKRRPRTARPGAG